MTTKNLCFAFLLFLLSGCSWSNAPAPIDTTVVVELLDVGQGDAILLTTAGRHWMIDTGEPGHGLSSRLKIRGVERLERIFITHHHLDHLGGVPELLRNFPVGQISLSADGEITPGWELVLRIADSLSILIDTLWRGDWVALGESDSEIGCRVLYPNHSLWQSGNNASLVLQLVTPDARALFTGDLELEGEQELLELEGERLASELLKVGHHASRTSSSLPFLAAVRPLRAAISVGVGNSYGHPHREAVADLLLLLGDSSRLYRTDLSGDLRFEIDNRGLHSPGALEGEGLLRW